MKTVKIISILTAIITVVLSAFGGLPARRVATASQRAVSASMSDEGTQKTPTADLPLRLPTQVGAAGNILERFKLSKLAKPAADKDQVPPLVKEARAFALYLNPPPAEPPPKPVMPANQTPGLPGLSVGPHSSSNQFKLIATCVSQSNPQLSLALIDLPGEGFKWVRQSSRVGYLVINEIKDGSLVVQDGQRTFSVLIEPRPQQASLVKGKSPLSLLPTQTPTAPLVSAAFTPVETAASPAVRQRRISGQDGSAATQTSAPALASQEAAGAWIALVENQQSLTTEEQALVQKFLDELDAILAGSGDDEAAIEESMRQADELAKKYFLNIDGGETIGQDAPKQNDATGKLGKPGPDTSKPNPTRRQPARRRPGFPSPP